MTEKLNSQKNLNKQEFRTKCFRSLTKEVYDHLEETIELAKRVGRMSGQEINENKCIDLICAEFKSTYGVIAD